MAVVVLIALGVPLRLAAAEPEGAPQEYADCGDPFTNHYGPFDYTNPIDRSQHDHIPIVEAYHFNAQVERLEKGMTSAFVMDDINYTLRVVPNHHRALNAVARFDIDKGGIPSTWLSAQCWFDRALQFRPKDGTVWLIYANWKARKGSDEEALEAYAEAKALAPDSAEIDYNLGLLYLKMGQYDKALAHAKVAYAGNYPLQGLRRKLGEKGYDVGN